MLSIYNMNKITLTTLRVTIKYLLFLGRFRKYLHTEVNIHYQDEISQVDQAIYRQELYLSSNMKYI